MTRQRSEGKKNNTKQHNITALWKKKVAKIERARKSAY